MGEETRHSHVEFMPGRETPSAPSLLRPIAVPYADDLIALERGGLAYVPPYEPVGASDENGALHVAFRTPTKL